MNFYLLKIEDKNDDIVEVMVFQSEKSMDDLRSEHWEEIAHTLGREADQIEGDIVEIEPILDPPVLY